MSGDVWVGTNPTTVRESLVKMNNESGKLGVDGYSQASPLMRMNVSHDIKKIHVDAIATQEIGDKVSTYPALQKYFADWKAAGHEGELTNLTAADLRKPLSPLRLARVALAFRVVLLTMRGALQMLVMVYRPFKAMEVISSATKLAAWEKPQP